MKEKVCVDCKYFKTCGDSERTESCSGKETKMLPGQLYDPENGYYNLPIFDNDKLFNDYTLRLFVDTFVANYGHKADRKLLWKHFGEVMETLVIDAKETLELCEDGILREVRGE